MSIIQLIRFGYGVITLIVLFVVFYGIQLTTESQEYLETFSQSQVKYIQNIGDVKFAISESKSKFSIFIKQGKFDSDVFTRLTAVIKKKIRKLSGFVEEKRIQDLTHQAESIEQELDQLLVNLTNKKTPTPPSVSIRHETELLAKLAQMREDVSVLVAEHLMRNDKDGNLVVKELDNVLQTLLNIDTHVTQYSQRTVIGVDELVEPLETITSTLARFSSDLGVEHAVTGRRHFEKDFNDINHLIDSADHSLKQLKTAYYQFASEWELMDPSASYILELSDTVHTIESRVDQRLAALYNAIYEHIASEEQHITQHMQSNRDKFILFGVGICLFTPLALWLVSRLLSSSFSSLLNGARTIAEGDYEYRVKVPRHKEFRELAENFNFMAEAVKERNVALKDNELKYRLLAENSPVMIFRMAVPEGTYDYVSPASKNIFGYPPENWYKRSDFLNNILHPSWKNYFQEGWACVLRGETPPVCEYQIIHKDGSVRWIEQLNMQTSDENANPVIVGVVTDITDRKKLENELRESDERFRSLFELSPDPSWIIEGRHFIECNQSAVNILGFSDKASLLKNHPSDLSPETQPDGESSFDKAERMIALARKQGIHRFEWRHLRADGTTFDAEVTLSTITLQDKPVIYCVWRDISERKKNEQELEIYRSGLEKQVEKRTKELEELTSYTRMLFNKTPVGLALCDLEGNIEDVNPAYLRIIGYSESEAKALSYWDITPIEFEEQELIQLKSLEETGYYGPYEKEYMHKNGSRVPVLLNGLLVEKDGKQYIWSSVEDITERKAAVRAMGEAKEKALTAARIKSEFLANMSHEIRTPLNAVLGLAKIGVRDNVSKETSEKFEHIIESGQHLLGIINDVLDFSKLEAGKLTIERRTFELIPDIENVIHLVRPQAQQKDLELNINYEHTLPEFVLGDSLRLRQILINILSNAIKFTSQGGVSLSVRKDGENIAFSIRDSGIGMTEEQVESLFMPFHQADSSTTRRFGGTGLGLVITQNLAKLMGGDIEINSVYGKGTTFTLTFPLPEQSCMPNNEILPQEKKSGDVMRLKDVVVLAAEDVEMNRVILQDLLEHEGAEVVFAENGQEVLDLIKDYGQSAFDVVLMDVQMPVMDGYEATSRLKHIVPQLPVIGLTAHALEEERRRALDAGMVGHVTKPFDVEILVEKILSNVKSSSSLVIKSPSSGEGRHFDDDDGEIPYDAIEGLNVREGLARFNGDGVLYEKVLLLFLKHHHDSAENIKFMLDNGDLDKLRVFAHSLKGSAGNIGAKQLHEQAAALEKACRLGNEEVQACYHPLVASLNELVKALLEINTEKA